MIDAVHSVLDRWQAGIAAHRPDQVAAVFTDDAIFQGLRPYTVGRQGVFDYYESQPVGLTVDYRINEIREPAAGVAPPPAGAGGLYDPSEGTLAATGLQMSQPMPLPC